MIKLIATDVDGTLVKDGTMTINPEYMTVIRKLTEMGMVPSFTRVPSTSVAISFIMLFYSSPI